MVRWSRVMIVLMLLALGGAPSVQADEASAKQQFMRGLTKLKEKNFEGAAADFEASFDAHPNVNCLFNLALSYVELNRFYDAYTAFEKIEKAFPGKLNDEDMAIVARNLADIKEKLPTLEIVFSPAGAVVTLDGETKDETSLSSPMVLPVGTHKVIVSKKGYETASKTVSLAVGDHLKTSFELPEKQASLDIVTDPGATVYVNEQRVGKTPFKRPLPLEKGIHEIKVEKPGFSIAEEQVELKPDEDRILNISLLPIPMRPEARRDTDGLLTYRPAFLIAGLAGTGVMAGVSAGLWAAAVVHRNDHNEKNQLLADLDGAWDEDLAEARDDDKAAASKYNTAAVVTTAITGAFVALSVTELVLMLAEKKKRDEKVSVSSGVVTVRF